MKKDPVDEMIDQAVDLEKLKMEIHRQGALNIVGNIASSTSTSFPWVTPTSYETSDKDLGTFSIKSVENGFSIVHTKGWKSKSFIAADLESLRDLIVTTLVSNELDK
jgi:hypothetical protein